MCLAAWPFEKRKKILNLTRSNKQSLKDKQEENRYIVLFVRVCNKCVVQLFSMLQTGSVTLGKTSDTPSCSMLNNYCKTVLYSFIWIYFGNQGIGMEPNVS